MTIRPYAVVLGGRLEWGLEVVAEPLGPRVPNGPDWFRIHEVRPHTGMPEPFALSPAFVNAHSHLEYRGFQDALASAEYWDWLRELTLLKQSQSGEDVPQHTCRAAFENRAAGVALIGEHSDTPVSGAAMRQAGLQGVVFQELITFRERLNPEEKRQEVARRAEVSRADFEGPVFTIPHAPWTVDDDSLRSFGAASEPISIHVAESVHENAFYADHAGPIADLYRAQAYGLPEPRGRVFEFLESLGLARNGAQFVHACDLNALEVERMAAAGVTVAHCPRSNVRLACPIAPVREMLDVGVRVGLGTDSPASGGPIDMFAEMRAAVTVSAERHAPVTAEEAWRMATVEGAATLGWAGWDIAPGNELPLIALDAMAGSTADLLDAMSPAKVRWADERIG